MKDFFEAIADLFVNVLFSPIDAMRSLELDNWWAANSVNWIFSIIGLCFGIYWILQLKKFNDNNEEDKDVSAHSFL